MEEFLRGCDFFLISTMLFAVKKLFQVITNPTMAIFFRRVANRLGKNASAE